MVSNNIAKTNKEASNIIQELITNSEILSNTNQFSESAKLSFVKPRKVIIIGAGIAGAALAKRLPSHQFEVLVITQTDSFSYLPRIPGIIRDPQYISKVDIKYKEVNGMHVTTDQLQLLPRIKVITSQVISASPEKIILQDNTEIVDFDYLVCCSGVGYDLSLLNIKSTSSDEKQARIVRGHSSVEICNAANDLKKAKRIAVIGGGASNIYFIE